MDKQQKCQLDILLDQYERTVCKYYTGDEETCTRVNDHLACNCDGQVKECDLWEYSNEYKEDNNG